MWSNMRVRDNFAKYGLGPWYPRLEPMPNIGCFNVDNCNRIKSCPKRFYPPTLFGKFIFAVWRGHYTKVKFQFQQIVCTRKVCKQTKMQVIAYT